MPTVTIRHPIDRHDDVASPRSDLLVFEEMVDRGDRCGDGGHAVTEFEARESPLRSWRRTVRLDGDEVVETISYRIGVGVWSPLFALPLRAAVRNPPRDGATRWWLPPDRLDRRAAVTLASACGLAVLGGFLASQLTQTLTFAAKEFHAGVGAQSRVLQIVRVGAVVTLAGALLADRWGRRPVAVGSLLVAAITGSLTALAPDLGTLTALQLVCRSTAVIAVLLLPVMTAEDLPAGSRAFAVGLLAMAGGLGTGGAILLLRVADIDPPHSWRAVFAVGALTIPLIVAAGRRLPETRRYTRLRAAARGVDVGTARLSSARLAALGLSLLALNAFITPVSQLQNEYLHTARGFSGGRITLFLLLTNSFGGISIIVGGRLADRRGRHLVATIGLVGMAVGNAAMYSTRGWPMWVWSVVGSAVGALCIPALGVLNPELFPTVRRGTATGVLNGAGVLGAVIGLGVTGSLITGADYGPTMTLLAVGPLLVIGLIRALPETARVPLEKLNPGDVSASPHIDSPEPSPQ